MKLKNRVGLVTGASRGIGKGIALRYSREGAKVILASDEASFTTGSIVSVDGGWTAYGYL